MRRISRKSKREAESTKRLTEPIDKMPRFGKRDTWETRQSGTE